MAPAAHPSKAVLRAGIAAAIIASLWCAVAGCSSSEQATPSIDRTTFEQRLVDRDRITADEASCVSDQVFAAYDDAAIRTISEQGVISLPSPQWAPYTYAVLDCVMGDELRAPPPSISRSTPPGTR